MKTVGKHRPLFISQSPIVFGKKINIILPNGEKRKGQFLIVDLDDIIASHNENSFQSSIDYPLNGDGSNINDRNYLDDKNAQSLVLKYARELDPERMITTSRTPSGTPIITQDGFVVSGNNRTMSLKLAVQNYPQNYDEYKKFLLEESEAFAIPNQAVTSILSLMNIKDSRTEAESFRQVKYIKINNPFLVRVDFDFPRYNTEELAKYNKDTKKAERPIDKAIKLSHILRNNRKCFESISNSINDFETFSEFYAKPLAQQKLAKIMLDCSIVAEQELSAYFVGGLFTEAGKDFIEQMLGAMVLNKDALIATNLAGAKKYRQTLITSLPVLIANANLPIGKLNKELNQAILFLYDMVKNSSPLFDILNQQSMFNQSMYDYKAVILSQLLILGRNTFKKTLEKYNQAIKNEESASLFGDKKPTSEIFELIIAKAIPDNELKVIYNSRLIIGRPDIPEEKEAISKGFPINRKVRELAEQVDKLYQKYIGDKK